ncbi:DUF4399 domain-containing protein [Pseudorhodoferax sp.]|uniref:DUF4399 domain-containing protein n=1 Tax=Pseudorhodoferax sp. TaxID=1993553 RepID=UPI002DD696FF|nr:DUF4399 domain-containing protein [Pseudorhodoferax sp.]
MAAATALGSAPVAWAAGLPAGDLERRCWLESTRERSRVNLREATSVEFSNLRHGFAVRSPFAVDFAIRGMGVAPAGVALGGTGHHHILINRPMPPSITAPIPFDDSHRHFGKGQTGTLLDLPPGRHTLRLLFADHEHRPHFVFSREITVQVRGPRSSTPRPVIDPARFAETCASWYQDEVATPAPPDEPLRVLNVRAYEPLTSPFTLHLGVGGMGICAAGAQPEKPEDAAQVGHFVLQLFDARSFRPVQTFRLSNGATQVNVFAGVGDYLARLRLVGPDGRDRLPPHELMLRVVKVEQ